MTRGAILLFAAFAVATPGTAPQAQTRATAPAPPGQRVAVPFAPPLDQPLHYRATTGADRGRGETGFWTDYVLTFGERPGGFRLEVRMADLGSSDIPADLLPAIRTNMLAAFPPYVLLLDAHGLIVGMEDADGYWARMQPRIDASMAALRSGQRFDSFTLQSMNEAKLGGTAGLAQTIAPIVRFAGADYILGQPAVSEAPVDDLMGLDVSERIAVTAGRVADGRLFLSVSAEVPEAETAQALRQLPPDRDAGLNPANDRLFAELRAARIARGEVQEIELELDTGLARRFFSTRRTDLDAGDARQRRTTTLLIERRD